MAPKLMYEFPRAAMNVELKRGRSAVNKFRVRTYDETAWTRAALHDWLAALRPRYVSDINHDTQLQDSFAATPHTLVVGMRFNRDTERMVMAGQPHGADNPAGWALIPQPTDKERRFLKRMNIELVAADIDCLSGVAATA